MIVWGGLGRGIVELNSGGRYDPGTDRWTATSNTDGPESRAGHTAVWTSSEMIIWGGVCCDCGGPCIFRNTGGRYNPGTDSWTATSLAGSAPSARNVPTAVWTGSEMTVWGGRDSNGSYLDTGGRYNPSTNSWTATSTTNAPTGRHYHTAVWTGSEMIVWGGQGSPKLFQLRRQILRTSRFANDHAQRGKAQGRKNKYGASHLERGDFDRHRCLPGWRADRDNA